MTTITIREAARRLHRSVNILQTHCHRGTIVGAHLVKNAEGQLEWAIPWPLVILDGTERPICPSCGARNATHPRCTACDIKVGAGHDCQNDPTQCADPARHRNPWLCCACGDGRPE